MPNPPAPRKRSYAPTAKVGAVGIAGAITTVFLAVTGIEADESLTAAITTIVAFIAGYITPSK